jgi:hypothetical protein
VFLVLFLNLLNYIQEYEIAEIQDVPEPHSLESCVVSLFMPPALENRSAPKKKATTTTSHKLLTSQDILEQKREKERKKTEKEAKKKVMKHQNGK